MAKGISLHIGLNKVSQRAYRRWDGALASCENDARAMLNIAVKSHFVKSTLLLREMATKARMEQQVQTAAAELEAGDLFLLTYSGHGASIKDHSGDETVDHLDESWCLYDGIYIDDKIHKLLENFVVGVRVVVVSDSCYSGSVIKNSTLSLLPTPSSKEQSNIKANVCLLASSEDDERSFSGAKLSKFTAILVEIWGNGPYNGNYFDFHQAITNKMPIRQNPSILILNNATNVFRENRPFII